MYTLDITICLTFYLNNSSSFNHGFKLPKAMKARLKKQSMIDKLNQPHLPTSYFIDVFLQVLLSHYSLTIFFWKQIRISLVVHANIGTIKSIGYYKTC